MCVAILLHIPFTFWPVPLVDEFEILAENTEGIFDACVVNCIQ